MNIAAKNIKLITQTIVPKAKHMVFYTHCVYVFPKQVSVAQTHQKGMVSKQYQQQMKYLCLIVISKQKSYP